MPTRQLRILFLPRERFPTFRGRIAILFGRELLRRGHRIDLVMQATHADVCTGPIPWHGRTVWVGPIDSRGSALAALRRQWQAFRHGVKHVWRARSDRYDAILVSDQFLLGTVAHFIARLHHLRFFFWLTFPYDEAFLWRGAQPFERWRGLLTLRGKITAAALHRFILPSAEHIFVQSPQMARNLAARSGGHDKMTPVLTGFDPADFPPAVAERSPRCSQMFKVVYLGTLVRERRLTVLIEMLSLLEQQGLRVSLLIVGDGEHPGDREELLNAARQRNVFDRLEITGFLPREEALQRTQEGDVGISPFYPDKILEVASPTKLIEYLALGMPAIANNQPEQREILRGSKAGLCTPWGAGHFARAVRWMAARTQTERVELGRRGQRWVRVNRSYERIADDLERSLVSLCG